MLLKRFLLIFALCCLGLTAVWSTTRSLTAAPVAQTALLNTPPASWVFNGIQNNAHMGSVVAVGDINGDGYDDLAIGEPFYDSAPMTDTGRVLIFLGNGLPITTGPTIILNPPPTDYLYFGASLAIGDLGPSEESAIAVGAPGYSNGEVKEGGVYVYNGMNLPQILTILESNQADSAFGSAVAAVPAIDNFGNDELLVGAPYQASFSGRAYFYQTTDMGFPITPTWTADGSPNSHFGHSVSFSDLANDGDADLLIGAPYASLPLTHQGAVYEFNIVSGTISSAPDFTLTGGSLNDEFGYAVLGVPVDESGLGSVLIGAPGYRDGLSPRGKAYLYKTSFSVPDWSATGQANGVRFGSALAIGDFDNNSDQDIFVGDKLYGPANMPEQGAVYIYLQTPGSTFNSDYDWKLFGDNPYSHFGVSIAAGDTLNAFPGDEVLAGAPNWNNGLGQTSLFHPRFESVLPNLVLPTSTVYVPAGVPFTYQATISGSAFVLVEWFMDNGQSYVSYIEDPGSGLPATITHTYHFPGVYTATVLALIPSNQNSRIEQTFTVHVVDAVSNIFFINNSPVRFNQSTGNATVNFTLAADTSTPVTYEVHYADEYIDTFTKTNGLPFSFTHIYTAPGYYRAEVFVNDGTQTVSKVSRVRVVRFLPLGPGNGGTITHTWSNNRPFVVDVPNGSVPLVGVELIFNPVDDATFNTPFPEDEDGFVVRGPIPTPLNNPVFFDIEVARDLDLQCLFLPIINTGGPITPTTGTGVPSPCVQEISGTFETPVEYTFKYNLEDLPIGTTPEDLRFFFFDETNGIWVDGADTCSGGSVYVVDTINQTITLPICHQSRWGVGAG